MISLDCTESYSVNQNDEAPALRDPNEKSFVFVRMGIREGKRAVSIHRRELR
jgi:hypothetical protein